MPKVIIIEMTRTDPSHPRWKAYLQNGSGAFGHGGTKEEALANLIWFKQEDFDIQIVY
jgi:hypothetical protein